MLHALVLYIVLRAMSLPSSVPTMELFAYTGYAYLPACAIMAAGVLGGEEPGEVCSAYGW